MNNTRNNFQFLNNPLAIRQEIQRFEIISFFQKQLNNIFAKQNMFFYLFLHFFLLFKRFESVHPSIYAIYDLIELVSDQQIAQQIRDHVVCIEGNF